jgi:capsular exopolysaccharide synthesis family protein
MEYLFQTATTPHVVPDKNGTGAAGSWKTDTGRGTPHTLGHEALRVRETVCDFGFIPPRKVDNAKIHSEVVLAQRLSREQEKNLHFIIERYRLLSNRLVEVAENLHSQIFLITSALAEEGKTLTSANLAFALSGIERKRTLLIDLDLRRYSLHSLLGVSGSSNEPLFLDAKDWRECLWALRPNLHALLPVRSPDQPNELLQSAAIHNLLTEARQEYDYILIDSAPLLLAADTHALLSIIDQALLVVRADHTPIACCQDALKILGDKAVGCILNDVKRLKYQSYYHGYYGTDDKQ